MKEKKSKEWVVWCDMVPVPFGPLGLVMSPTGERHSRI